MKDEEKLEALMHEFVETSFKNNGVPFEIPIVHIHQDTMPTLDHSKDSFEYSIQFIIQKHQQQINEEIMKNIRQIMKEKGISEYYSIDEKRLLEIFDEAKAFEIIKEKMVDTNLIKISKNFGDYCTLLAIKTLKLQNIELMGNAKSITEEEYEIVKRALELI